MKLKCYQDCVHKRSVPGTHHIMCANPDPDMTGNPHGIKHGWFIYPLVFDPIWGTKECENFMSPEDYIEASVRATFCYEYMHYNDDSVESFRKAIKEVMPEMKENGMWDKVKTALTKEKLNQDDLLTKKTNYFKFKK